MASETNFVELYRMLAVQPGCAMAEFKQAYRRRIATLHPDRYGDGGQDPSAAAQLRQLTALYAAAVAFERRHGRLPGAASKRPLQPPVPRPRPTAAGRDPRRHSPGRLPIVLLLVAGLLWLGWDSGWWTDAAEPDSAAIDASGPMPWPQDPAKQDALRVGMTADAVRHAIGLPAVRDDTRWDYGQSWVRFDKGQVVDWYSSPLQPLANASSHPPPTNH